MNHEPISHLPVNHHKEQPLLAAFANTGIGFRWQAPRCHRSSVSDSLSSVLSKVSSPFSRPDFSFLRASLPRLPRGDAEIPTSRPRTREQVFKAGASCPDTWTVMGGSRVRITHREMGSLMST